MKKSIFFIFYLLLAGMVSAQVVTTEPAFITRDYTGTIKVIFDPSEGNKGMVGATACYAHTGVTVSDATGTEEWLCAPTWRDGGDKHKLVQEGSKWILTIDNMYEYYNCAEATGKTFEQLCFVFNDGPTGSKEGKDVGDKDIYVDIYEATLQVRFDSPGSNQLANAGTALSFLISSSDNANLTLKVNGTTAATTTGTSLSHTYTFSSIGDYTCIAEASTTGGEIARDTVYVCVLDNAPTGSRPSNVKEGINYYSDDHTKVTLVMYAKDKSNVLPDNVILLGDFNDWAFLNEYQLKRDGTTGYWWITVDGLTPGKEYAFQYAVKIGDNVIQISDAYTEKVLDPYNDSYLSSIYPGLTYPEGGDGIVSVFQTNKPAFNWSNKTLNFKGPDKNNLVIYELWVYDFSPYRTIKAVTNRLDYLDSLGVNAIELMPITEFDGNISWGYNPNHFFAPDKAYGTAEDYKTFIDECHKRGIAVILDMVFNHSTGNHPFAKLYYGNNGVASNNPWYNTVAPHSDSVNQDYNHGFSGTLEHFKRVLQYWIEEYKIDGYRMDLSKGLCGENCNDRENIINAYYDAVKEVKEDAYFILEHWVGGSEENRLVANGMLAWTNMNNAYSQTAMGWLADGDNLSGANKKGWVSYCESHDEERNFFKAKTYGNGTTILNNENARLARVPLNAAFNVLLQGPKMLWQFQELGYDYSITHNGTDRVDPKPVPESLGWYTNDTRRSVYEKVAQVLHLRTKLLPEEMFTDGTISASIGSGLAVRHVTWTYGNEKVYIAGNFGVTDGTSHSGNGLSATLPAGTWYDYYTQEVKSGNTSVALEPGELKIFTTNPSIVAPNIKLPLGIENPYAKKQKCIVYPTMADDIIWIESEENISSIQIVGMRGDVVKREKAVDSMDISDLPQGLYLVIVSYGNTQEAVKIIKR